MRREDHRVTELQQGDLVLVAEEAEEVQVVQTQGLGLSMQLFLQRTGAHDHYRIIEPLHGVEQDMQALVITHHSNKQEKLVAQLLAPAFGTRCVRLRIT